MNQNNVCLDVNDISLSFGGNRVLSSVSFNVIQGEIRAIIGPNGAGKTSTLNCVSGFYTPDSGNITYNDYDVIKFVLARRLPAATLRLSRATSLRRT